MLQQFALLLGSYQAAAGDSRVTFHGWIVMNGVTDPRQQIWLLWLYWQYTNRVAVD